MRGTAVTAVTVVLGVGAALAFAGCGGSPSPERPASRQYPSATVVPDEFVLRDLRKDAARHLRCQVPRVQARLSGWTGSQGNVVAFGCGYQMTYYVTCLASHQCSFTGT
jgi:hypothetical protein